jgi:hypothetical protein
MVSTMKKSLTQAATLAQTRARMNDETTTSGSVETQDAPEVEMCGDGSGRTAEQHRALAWRGVSRIFLGRNPGSRVTRRERYSDVDHEEG